MLRCASPGACSKRSEESPDLLRLKPHNHCGVHQSTPHSSGFARLAGAAPAKAGGTFYEAVLHSRLLRFFYEVVRLDSMKIAVIHGKVPAGAGRDEKDVVVGGAFGSEGLAALGHEPVAVPVSLNLAEAARALADLQPGIVFNLAETLAGKGSLIHLVPALLDALHIPYTGAGTAAMLLTSNKLFAKRQFAAAGIPTPPWLTEAKREEGVPIEGAWLVKSPWGAASLRLA